MHADLAVRFVSEEGQLVTLSEKRTLWNVTERPHQPMKFGGNFGSNIFDGVFRSLI